MFTDNHQEAPLAGRIVALDGFRAIAFLAVFAHHVFRVPLLWASTDLFFVLSGYEYICKTWAKEPERFTLDPLQQCRD